MTEWTYCSNHATEVFSRWSSYRFGSSACGIGTYEWLRFGQALQMAGNERPSLTRRLSVWITEESDEIRRTTRSSYSSSKRSLTPVFTRAWARASRDRSSLRRIVVLGCLDFETAWIRTAVGGHAQAVATPCAAGDLPSSRLPRNRFLSGGYPTMGESPRQPLERSCSRFLHWVQTRSETTLRDGPYSQG